MPGVLGSLHIEVYQGKGKKSRNIPVSSQFAHDIAEYIRDVRPATVPQRYAKHGLSGWLFFDRRRKKYSRKQIYRMVVRVGKNAGIAKRITPHMWRHRFATRTLDKSGKNLVFVKTLLGHSSIATTEKYLHLVEMAFRESGDMLDQKNQGLTN
jgi:integrase/recombinase XerD